MPRTAECVLTVSARAQLAVTPDGLYGFLPAEYFPPVTFKLLAVELASQIVRRSSDLRSIWSICGVEVLCLRPASSQAVPTLAACGDAGKPTSVVVSQQRCLVLITMSALLLNWLRVERGNLPLPAGIRVYTALEACGLSLA